MLQLLQLGTRMRRRLRLPSLRRRTELALMRLLPRRLRLLLLRLMCPEHLVRSGPAQLLHLETRQLQALQLLQQASKLAPPSVSALPPSAAVLRAQGHSEGQQLQRQLQLQARRASASALRGLQARSVQRSQQQLGLEQPRVPSMRSGQRSQRQLGLEEPRAPSMRSGPALQLSRRLMHLFLPLRLGPGRRLEALSEVGRWAVSLLGLRTPTRLGHGLGHSLGPLALHALRRREASDSDSDLLARTRLSQRLMSVEQLPMLHSTVRCWVRSSPVEKTGARLPLPAPPLLLARRQLRALLQPLPTLPPPQPLRGPLLPLPLLAGSKSSA